LTMYSYVVIDLVFTKASLTIAGVHVSHMIDQMILAIFNLHST
jgi:hypothetical protein